MEEEKILKDAPGHIYVDSPESMARLIGALRGVSRVALDTEADSLHHYFEKVCLIQLSFSGAHYIVDPLVGFPLTEFLEELSVKEMIIQGADYDLRMMKRSFEFRPKAPVFDTMLAAQVLGYEKIGLAALAEKFCGVVLSKSGQKSDWSRRPLTEKQLTYAADDTRYLERIADAMAGELATLGREKWHRESCARVVETSGLAGKNDDKEAWRVKGSSKLMPRQLAMLRELWKWRDDEARRRDRPPFMILLNEDLVGLAEWRVSCPEEPLSQGSRAVKRISGEPLLRLEEAIRRGENLSPSDWPTPPERVRLGGVPPSSEKIEALLAACKLVATELHVEACFLVSRAAATAIVRHEPRTIERVMEAAGMLRWQAERVMPVIKKVLWGEA